MAEGGEDFEMADGRNYPLPENYDREIGETSFVNPVFGEETEYNTIDNSNLIDPETPGPPPQVELAVEELRISQKEDIILNSLRNSTWSMEGPFNEVSNRGIKLLAAKAKLENGRLYVDLRGKRVYLLKGDGNFYAYSSLKKTYGSIIADEIKDILLTFPEQQELESTNTRVVPDVPGAQQEEESIFKTPPRRTNVLVTHLLEDVINSRQPIDKLIDASEDQLKAVGFTDHAIGEMRGLKKAGDDFAALQAEKKE